MKGNSAKQSSSLRLWKHLTIEYTTTVAVTICCARDLRCTAISSPRLEVSLGCRVPHLQGSGFCALHRCACDGAAVFPRNPGYWMYPSEQKGTRRHGVMGGCQK